MDIDLVELGQLVMDREAWCSANPGKDWGWEEKGMTEDEMAGWHHQLDGHGFG